MNLGARLPKFCFAVGKHTGRRITWQPNQGTVDLKAAMPKARHELNVTTYGEGRAQKSCITGSEPGANQSENQIKSTIFSGIPPHQTGRERA